MEKEAFDIYWILLRALGYHCRYYWHFDIDWLKIYARARVRRRARPQPRHKILRFQVLLMMLFYIVFGSSFSFDEKAAQKGKVVSKKPAQKAPPMHTGSIY